MMEMNGRGLTLSIILLLLLFDARLIASGDIGPSTIATGYTNSATKIEQQRKVFRNPRGNGRYYALVQTEALFWHFFKSSDGETWTDTDVKVFAYDLSIWIWEDSSNSRLIVFVFYKLGWIYVECYEIPDSGTDPSSIYSVTVAIPTDDFVFYPVGCLDTNGYLWVAWIDEFTSAGKQRFQLRVTCSTTTYPVTSPGPTWAPIVDWYDGFRGDLEFSKTSIIPLTANADVGIALSEAEPTKSYIYRFKARTGTYSGGTITLGSIVDFPSLFEHTLWSIVAEDGGNSDVFLLEHTLSYGILCQKWDVSEGTQSSFGEIVPVTTFTPSLALAIDKTSSPNILYAFYVKSGITGYVFYKTRPVDGSEEWSDEVTITDDSEALDYLSCSYEDSNKDSRIQMIYTRQGTWDVRFVEVGPEAEEEGPPVIFPSTGHKVTAFLIGSMFLLLAYMRRKRPTTVFI